MRIAEENCSCNCILLLKKKTRKLAWGLVLQIWEFPNMVVSNLALLHSFALFCTLFGSFVDLRLCSFADLRFCSFADLCLRSFALICALLRSFACFCVRLRLERPRLGFSECSESQTATFLKSQIQFARFARSSTEI